MVPVTKDTILVSSNYVVYMQLFVVEIQSTGCTAILFIEVLTVLARPDLFQGITLLLIKEHLL